MDFLQEGRICQIIVWNSHTIEFYGFHSNWPQKYEEFSMFQIENDIETLEIIQNCGYEDLSEEKLFFDVFIKNLYSCIKKRFPIQTIVDKFKYLVAQKKLKNIWMPVENSSPHITMNESFLLMYLLRNSDQKLKIELMNLVKNFTPLPLFINQF